MARMSKTITLSKAVFADATPDQILKSLSLAADSASLFMDMSREQVASFLNPQDSDYLYIPARALSASPDVQGGLLNFAHNGGQALQDAVSLFNGLTVLKDHVFTVDNWVGKTMGAYWDTETPGAPPGVTLMLKIDKMADPKVARGLVSGALDSVSVTIEFDYVPSHPDMSEHDFYMKLGTVVDGKMVQALVTKIIRLYEISLVWQGADAFAKTLTPEGSIQVPGKNSNSASPTTHHLTEDPMNLKALAAKLGLTNLGDNPTEEQLTTALQAALAAAEQKGINANTETVNSLTKTLEEKSQALEASNASLKEANDKLATQEPLVKLGQTFISAERDEAVRLYKVAEGDKASEALLTMLSTASLEQVQAFKTTFQAQAEKIAPLSCTKCGCTELSRRKSSSAGDSNTDPAGKDKPIPAETARLKAGVTSIHG